MKNSILWFVVSFFLIGNWSKAQTTEAYFQGETNRLEKVSQTEEAIEIYIAQQINTYDFTSVVLELNDEKNEDGSSLTGEAYQNALLSAKRQLLRNNFFALYPEKLAYYFAGILKQECLNGGFEEGNTSGFSFFSQDYTQYSWGWLTNNPISVYASGPLNSANSRANLVSSNGFDPIFSGLPRVNSGNYAVKLNMRESSSDGTRTATRMSRVFTINENFISFNYALVFQDVRDGGHTSDPTRAPYYYVLLKRMNGTVVYKYIITGNDFSQFPLSTSPNFLSTGWKCHYIDTSAWLGETLQMDIVVSNCGNRGHFAYGYFDNFCGFDIQCTPPAPFVNLNPLSMRECPAFPLNVTGNFAIPDGASLSSLQLQILENNNHSNIINTVHNPNVTGGNFSFSLSSFEFYPYGTNSITDFKFKVLLTYVYGGSLYTLSYMHSGSAADVSFTNCSTPCFEIIYIDQPVTSSQLFQASEAIIASSAIYPDLTVEYRAGYYIDLNPGFWATGESMGDFLAHIAPCLDEGINNYIEKPHKKVFKQNDKVKGSPLITIVPNPVSDILTIKTDEQIISIKVYNTEGKMIQTSRLDEGKVDVKHLPSGIYILSVQTINGHVNKKFIKK